VFSDLIIPQTIHNLLPNTANLTIGYLHYRKKNTSA